MPRTRTESVLVILIVAFVAALVISYRSPQYHAQSVIGEVLIVVIFLFIAVSSFREVPSQPPSVAIPTFLGSREPSVIREGWVFVFPGIEDLIIVDYVPEESMVTFPNVRCILEEPKPKAKKKPILSGGAVSVKLSIAWVPDISSEFSPDETSPRLRLYLNNGGRERLRTMIEGILEGAVRQLASTMTWEQVALGKARLSADLIALMTGIELPAGSDEEAVKAHLAKALTNGVADIRDLGVKIRRVIVTEVEPEGELKEAAEQAAKELLERTADIIETDTVVALADKIFEAAKLKESPISYDEALKAARIQLGMSAETIVRGSGSAFVDAAALLRRGQFSRRSRRGDTDTNIQ